MSLGFHFGSIWPEPKSKRLKKKYTPYEKSISVWTISEKKSSIFPQVFILIFRFSQDTEATPYLNKKRLQDGSIEVGALDELSLYLYQETRFPRKSYDVVLAITK